MLRGLVTAYPADLTDEGLDNVLDRLQGGVGIHGLSIWGAAPPVTLLRSRGTEPRWIHTDGGLLFPFNESHYTGTRCKPVLSNWGRGRNLLGAIAEACARRALPVRVKVSAGLTGRMAERHPGMAAKNVWGDASPRALCLINPDVQAYLVALVADISDQFDVSGVTLTDFAVRWPDGAMGCAAAAVGPGEIERRLLESCYCESCHQRAGDAGVEVDRVRRLAQAALEKCLDRGTPQEGSWSEFLAHNESVAARDDWRAGELARLWRRLAEACPRELRVERACTGTEPLQQSRLCWESTAGVVTRVTEFATLPSGLCAAARQCELCVPARLTVGEPAAELVHAFQRAGELGFAAIEIDGLAHLSDTALENVRRAIRIGRRTTDD